MTNTQFVALCRLLRIRPGAATYAARAVLVDGLRNADAARLHGCTQQQVSNSVRRMRVGMALVKQAA